MKSKHGFWGVLSLLLAIPLLLAGTAGAKLQGGGPGGPNGIGARRGPMTPDDRLKQMTKDLNLTDDQQTKIKPILVDEQKKMEGLRNDSNGDRESTRTKMMQARDDANTQIRALLDDKQKDLMDKQQQGMQNRRRGRPGGPGGPSGDNPGPPPQNN